MSAEEADDLSFEALTFGSQSDAKPPLHSPPSDHKKPKDAKKDKNKSKRRSGALSPRGASDSVSGTPVGVTPSEGSGIGINIPSDLAGSAPSIAFTPSTPSEKPDTILVLKNLPFSLKQDQLEDLLKPLSENLPQSVNLHYEGGVFKGMAFIKYRQLEEAVKVFDNLNGVDVGGRKVRVEYKRKHKEKAVVGSPGTAMLGDVPAEWTEDEELKKIWDTLNDFKGNHTQMELSFAPTLTSVHRKHIHAMADKLKLTHFSLGDDHDRHICVSKKNGSSERRGIDIQSGTRSRGNSGAGMGRSFEGQGSLGKSWERDRPADPAGSSFGMSSSFGRGQRDRGMSGGSSSYNRSSYLSSSPMDSHGSGRLSATSPTSMLGTTPPKYSGFNPSSNPSTPVGSASAHGDAPLFQPVRQPRGPDGSKGFPKRSPATPRTAMSAPSSPSTPFTGTPSPSPASTAETVPPTTVAS
eukprot:TRINITY_DN969_c0_g1_i1.p1 TRINITY_DN969_c0_g1~~TRINITY_DN969_c0_g1_i1.p1  ORF type:complete len:465 (-),score=126.80 TRINITY_DN969_c0_g1_i1:163-1557(-)